MWWSQTLGGNREKRGAISPFDTLPGHNGRESTWNEDTTWGYSSTVTVFIPVSDQQNSVGNGESQTREERRAVTPKQSLSSHLSLSVPSPVLERSICSLGAYSQCLTLNQRNLEYCKGNGIVWAYMILFTGRTISAIKSARDNIKWRDGFLIPTSLLANRSKFAESNNDDISENRTEFNWSNKYGTTENMEKNISESYQFRAREGVMFAKGKEEEGREVREGAK